MSNQPHGPGPAHVDGPIATIYPAFLRKETLAFVLDRASPARPTLDEGMEVA